MIMEKYLINKNELLSFLRYEILFKWKAWQEKTKEENRSFKNYLLKNTPYQPEHDFIQNFCKTKKEKQDPINTGVYDDILPSDIARYQLETLYKPY